MLIVDGKPQFGHWTGEITNTDLRQYRRGTWRDVLLPMREKRWQYVGLYSDEFIIGLAVVHTGYLGNVFAYVYNRRTGALWEMERNAPLGNGIRFDRNVSQSVIVYRAEDERLRFDNNLELNRRGVDVRLENDGLILDIRAEIIDDQSKQAPLQTLMPTPDDDCSFTHKNAGMRVEGHVRLGNTHWDLATSNSRAVLDYTIGYHARETNWNWASFAGQTADGVEIGLNLANPTHQENACWINGQQHRVGHVRFQYTDSVSAWHIESIDSTDDAMATVNLIFQPKHCRYQDINMWILKSQFQQPCGVFSGTITTPDGSVVEFENVPGVVEEHAAKW